MKVAGLIGCDTIKNVKNGLARAMNHQGPSAHTDLYVKFIDSLRADRAHFSDRRHVVVIQSP